MPLRPGGSGASCGYTYELFSDKAIDHGADLSRYRNLKLTIRYTGSAHYLRVASGISIRASRAWKISTRRSSTR
jgi:hypothetical protein